MTDAQGQIHLRLAIHHVIAAQKHLQRVAMGDFPEPERAIFFKKMVAEAALTAVDIIPPAPPAPGDPEPFG